MKMRRLGVMALAAALLAGCGGDDGPTEPPPPGGSTIVKVSGDTQSAPVSTALPLPLTVRVQDSGGQPLSGRTVSWALAGASGPNSQLSAPTTTTGSDGRTSITFTLGDGEGQYQVRASISGSSVTFTATATGAGSSGPQVGDTLSFVFSCIGDSVFPNAPDSITGVIRRISTKAIVVEDTVAAGSFTDPEYVDIAQNFDAVIDPVVTQYFGSPGDVDSNDGRVILLYSAGVNNLSDSYSTGFISGFFCGSDLSSFGNNAEMFYLMVPDPNGDYTGSGETIDKAFVRMSTDNTVAHEFQHMINAWRRTQAGLGAMEVWLNEGLSHLAEEIVGHAANGFVPGTELGPAELIGSQQALDNFNKYYRNDFVNLATYLVAPGDTAALVVSSDPLDIGTFRMRGAAWSFVRYLLDRFDTAATEPARASSLVVSPAASSRDGVAGLFGVPFEVLASEWNAMFSVEDREPSRPGGPGPEDMLADPRSELLLRSYQLRTFYDSPQIAPFIDGILGQLGLPTPGGYPLQPTVQDLADSTDIAVSLYTATARFDRLVTQAGSGGTDLLFEMPVSSSALSLAAGSDTVLVGSAGVSLPAHVPGDEYELVIVALQDSPDQAMPLGLVVDGTPAAAPSRTLPPSLSLETAGGRSGRLAEQDRMRLAWLATQYGFDLRLREQERLRMPGQAAGPFFRLQADASPRLIVIRTK